MTVLNASSEELTSTMIRIGRFSLITLLMIFGGFLIYGPTIHSSLGWRYIQKRHGQCYYNYYVFLYTTINPVICKFIIRVQKPFFPSKAKTYITLIVLGTVIVLT